MASNTNLIMSSSGVKSSYFKLNLSYIPYHATLLMTNIVGLSDLMEDRFPTAMWLSKSKNYFYMHGKTGLELI